MSNELLRLLFYATGCTTCALILAIGLRHPLRMRFGAGVAYLVWLLIPAALLALLIPTQELVASASVSTHLHITLSRATAAALPVARGSVSAGLLSIWLVGACSLLILQALQQMRFVQALPVVRNDHDLVYVQAADISPLVVGLIRPRIVLPLDFESQYTASERNLILLHERLHVRRGDLIANAVCALMRCVFWFNPFIHLAAPRFQFDQELACDEAVLRRQPTLRAAYARAMLKSQTMNTTPAVACPWPNSNFLKERIMQLGAPSIPRAQRLGGRTLVILMVGLTAYGAWAAEPAHSPGPVSFQSDSVNAGPEGTTVLSGHVMIHGKGPLAISPGPSVEWMTGTPPRVQWHGPNVHITLGGHPLITSGNVVAAISKRAIDLTINGAVEVPKPAWMRHAECVSGCDEGSAKK